MCVKQSLTVPAVDTELSPPAVESPLTAVNAKVQARPSKEAE